MSAKDVIKQLSDMSIDEVSFVDRPANPEAKIAISKRDDEIDKASPGQGDMHVDKPLDEEEEEVGKDAQRGYPDEDEEEEEPSRLKKFFSKVFGTDDPEEIEKQNPFQQQQKPPGLMPPGPMTPQAAPMNGPPQVPFQQMQMQPPAAPNPMMQQGPMQQQAQAGLQGVPGQVPGMGQQPGGLAPLPQEVVDYINELEKQVQSLSQEGGGNQSGSTNQNPFGKSEEFEDMPEDVAFLEELAKNLEQEEQREAIYKALDLVAEAEDRASQAEEIAKAEREHRLNREYVELAKSYEHLPVSAEEFGPVLKRLHERMESEDVEVITKVFSTVDDSLSSLFDEVGKRGGYDNPEAKFEAEVNEIRKSDPDISHEQAMEQVLQSNPRMYDEYLREQTAGRA